MTNVTATSSYDPRRVIVLATSADYFKRELPTAVKQLVTAGPVDLGSQQANAAMEQMQTEAKQFAEQYHHRLLMFLYGKWATANGITKNVEDIGEIPKHINELTADEANRWNNYLMLVEIPRETVVDALKANTPLHNLPSTRYLDSGEVCHVAKSLFQARNQFVLSLLPDITDDEAKRLFGQLTNAEDVHHTATEELLA